MGGFEKTSWVVLSDPESIQKSGVPITITASAIAAYPATRAQWMRVPTEPAARCITTSAIVHLSFRIADLHQGDAQHEHEEDERSRRRPARIKGNESLLIDIVNQGVGSIDRAALGHHLDDVERLEGVEDGGNTEKKDDRREHRQGDRAKAPPSTRAIDLGRLVEITGDGLQPGEEDHRGKAEVLPDGDDEDGGHRPGRIR